MEYSFLPLLFISVSPARSIAAKEPALLYSYRAFNGNCRDLVLHLRAIRTIAGIERTEGIISGNYLRQQSRRSIFERRKKHGSSLLSLAFNCRHVRAYRDSLISHFAEARKTECTSALGAADIHPQLCSLSLSICPLHNFLSRLLIQGLRAATRSGYKINTSQCGGSRADTIGIRAGTRKEPGQRIGIAIN